MSEENMRVWKTGARRASDENKPRYDLIPARALRRVAHHFALGAALYGADNWQKGIPRQQVLASAMRHVEAWRCWHEEDGVGDPVQHMGEDHLAAAVWNLLVLMQYEEDGMDVPDVSA